MLANNIIVKQILRSDNNRIEELQQYVSKEYNTKYPEHSNWMSNKAIPDIKAGRKLAFGAFILHREGNRYKEILVGSVILSRTGYSKPGVLELRSFTAYSDIFSQLGQSSTASKEVDSDTIIYEQLLRIIENYSTRRGFEQLEIELPKDRLPLVNILLNQGFTVVSLDQGRYKQNQITYILRKDLRKYYCWDPYDFINISKWILKTCFRFDVG